MREVPVTGGYTAVVDDEDCDLVAGHRWQKLQARGSLTVYARTSIGGKTVYMHRLIMGLPNMGDVDHIDGNGLNNQRSNLRLVTHSVNVSQGHSRRAYDAWKASKTNRIGNRV